MKEFISCDWGTSAFRMRLVNAATNIVSTEVRTDRGIAATFKLWQNSKIIVDRFSFYKTALSEHIAMLEHQHGYALVNMTIVISGMASSSIGMTELPYKELPFRIDGADLLTHVIEPSKDFTHKMIIVSGVKSANDVMRGEETMLVGCNLENSGEAQLFIFPGTHSKHMVVKNGEARDFKTYMTGEIFDLLLNRSILAASVEEDNTIVQNNSNSNFINGVMEGAASNLLHSIFYVRTNQLFKKLSNKENYHYLSGLLIGAELKSLLQHKFSSVTLVSSESLAVSYLQALRALEVKKNVQQKNADEALIKGQCSIFTQYKSKI